MIRNRVGVILCDKEDMLGWNWKDSNGIILTNKSYDVVIGDHIQISPKWWERNIWNWNIPIKLQCFICLRMENKVLTWNNLLKMGFYGPSISVLCRYEVEAASHLFDICTYFNNVWEECCSLLHFNDSW